MSAVPVARPPRRAHEPSRSSEPDRHIEIVTTRAQHRARPRSFYAIVAVGSVFALLITQLLLSILLSDGAYQISSLQSEQKQLASTEQALSESLDLLASPQHLATEAEQLGMVVGTNPAVFLYLADGSIAGVPAPASGDTGVVGADGGLVANSLLVPGLPEEIVPEQNTGGAPSTTTTSANVPSTIGTPVAGGPIPSPQTR